MSKNKFAFSVIVPVYNTEEYLNEAIKSILNQKADFADQIQIILVNSASTDGSRKICAEYESRYPDRVTVLDLEENKGPSHARNAAIPYVQGKYTAFLDSDDKWALDAFGQAYRFFEEHYDDIDLIAPRIGNFEAFGGWHAVDYTFYKDRVVNIFDEYDCIKTTAPVFLKSEILKEFQFDEAVKYNEDTKFATQIILRKGRYGALRSAVYWYRRRRKRNSLLQTVESTPHYYFEALPLALNFLVEESKRLYGEVIPYVQYVVMYSLQWRLLNQLPNWMTEEERKRYTENIRELLLQIDDHIILEQRNIYKEYKIFCLRLKYGDDVYQRFQQISGKFIFNNLCWCAADNKAIFNYWWHGVDSNGSMRLTGEINFPFPAGDYDIFAQDNMGNRYPLIYYPEQEKEKLALGQCCLTIRPFAVQLPIENVTQLQFILCYRGGEFPLYIAAGKFSGLSLNPPESYCAIGGYIFSRQQTSILVEKNTRQTARKHKKALWRGLFKRKDKRQIFCRIFAAILRKLSGKQDIRISFGTERIV